MLGKTPEYFFHAHETHLINARGVVSPGWWPRLAIGWSPTCITCRARLALGLVEARPCRASLQAGALNLSVVGLNHSARGCVWHAVGSHSPRRPQVLCAAFACQVGTVSPYRCYAAQSLRA